MILIASFFEASDIVSMTASTLFCLTGPTAAGKSAASIALAERWPIEIINVDSASIYRGMDIGTAKPDAAEQARIRHHLLDILDPAESYSAAQFRDDALERIRDIQLRERIPVLCGGTMLYYRALQQGLHDLPGASPVIRQELNEQARKHGWPALHAELARIDPVTAQRLAPHDSQRIQRALEVFRSSGRPLSDWLAQEPPAPDHGLDFRMISLEPSDRIRHHERIAHRFHAMLDAGLEEEVEKLHQRPDLHPGLPAIRSVGYRQLWAFLEGEMPRAQAIERALTATRQLAKRQLTWLRAMPQRHIIDSQSDQVPSKVVDAMAELKAD